MTTYIIRGWMKKADIKFSCDAIKWKIESNQWEQFLLNLRASLCVLKGRRNSLKCNAILNYAELCCNHCCYKCMYESTDNDECFTEKAVEIFSPLKLQIIMMNMQCSLFGFKSIHMYLILHFTPTFSLIEFVSKLCN